jgi:signal transduction histidine kinase
MTERRDPASLFAHCFKTPLSSISTATELLARHVKEQLNEGDARLLEVAQRNARQLELRLNQLLSASEATPEGIRLVLDLAQLEAIHGLKAEVDATSGSPEPPPAPESPPPSPPASPPDAGDRIIVHADPEIADLIPKFLENRSKDIDLIVDALEKKDLESVRTIGHGMKGAGGGYGFTGISDIGREIETAAKEQDSERILQGVKQLYEYLQRVEVIYDES